MATITSVPASGFDVLPIAPGSAEILNSACPHCAEPLVLHMPDPMAPDRMLGVCTDCGGWHYIEVSPTGDEAVLISLPNARSYWHSHAG